MRLMQHEANTTFLLEVDSSRIQHLDRNKSEYVMIKRDDRIRPLNRSPYLTFFLASLQRNFRTPNISSAANPKDNDVRTKTAQPPDTETLPEPRGPRENPL